MLLLMTPRRFSLTLSVALTRSIGLAISERLLFQYGQPEVRAATPTVLWALGA